MCTTRRRGILVDVDVDVDADQPSDTVIAGIQGCLSALHVGNVS
jgi:hypothetical protein